MQIPKTTASSDESIQTNRRMCVLRSIPPNERLLFSSTIIDIVVALMINMHVRVCHNDDELSRMLIRKTVNQLADHEIFLDHIIEENQ